MRRMLEGAWMQRKLTITMDEAVYEGLERIVGHGRISCFIEDLVRPHVMGEHQEEGYRAMAADAGHEREASEWIHGLAGDRARETRRGPVDRIGKLAERLAGPL